MPRQRYLVNRGGLGKAKHVDMQNLWIQKASRSGRFTTKKVDTSVNPADLVTKPVSKARNEQFMSLMGYEFVDNETSTSKGQPTTTQGLQRPKGFPHHGRTWREGNRRGICEGSSLF